MKLAIIYIISHGKVKIEILNLTLKAVKGTNELLPRKANPSTLSSYILWLQSGHGTRQYNQQMLKAHTYAYKYDNTVDGSEVWKAVAIWLMNTRRVLREKRHVTSYAMLLYTGKGEVPRILNGDKPGVYSDCLSVFSLDFTHGWA